MIEGLLQIRQFDAGLLLGNMDEGVDLCRDPASPGRSQTGDILLQFIVRFAQERSLNQGAEGRERKQPDRHGKASFEGKTDIDWRNRGFARLKIELARSKRDAKSCPDLRA